MSWAAGTFSRTDGSTGCANDAAASIGIEAARMDDRLNDLATGINNTLNKAGQNAATADLPMGGFKHTNVAAATARTEYARLSQVQDGTAIYCGTAGGTANALTATAPFSMAALVTGAKYILKAASANTGAATLNINSIGAASIVNLAAAALRPGAIRANEFLELVYTGSTFMLLNPYVEGQFTSWTPGTLTANGAMTVSNQAVLASEYEKRGDIFDFMCSMSFDLGGVANTDVYLPLPITANGTNFLSGSCVVNTVSAAVEVGIISLSSTTQLRVNRPAGANWTTGAGRTFNVSGKIRVA